MKALTILTIKMAGAGTELRRHRSRSVETARSRQHRRSPPCRQSCPSVRRASQKTNSDVVAISFTHQSRHQPPHRPRQPHQLRPRRSRSSSTAPSNLAAGSFSDHARQPPWHIDASVTTPHPPWPRPSHPRLPIATSSSRLALAAAARPGSPRFGHHADSQARSHCIEPSSPVRPGRRWIRPEGGVAVGAVKNGCGRSSRGGKAGCSS